jgi:hypothetical protein
MKLNNEYIIVCLMNDISIYWVHNLENNKEVIFEHDDFVVYKSNRCLYLYYKKDLNSLYPYLIELSDNNYVHLVMTDFKDIDEAIEILDYKNKFDYSIVNHMGETLYDTHPRKVKDLKNIKYYFSCSDLLNDKNEISDFQKTNKFIKDYKYSFIYFYFKYGFNFIQKENIVTYSDDRKTKFFLYTKSKKESQRERLINLALDTKKIKSKEFTEQEYFWFKYYNHSHHISFMIDYTLCKFNLVMETQPLTKEPNNLSRFITEKTLKTLMVPTPSYLVLQEDVYNELKEFGFYFLNEEFGDYNFNNYEKFCEFLKQSNDQILNDLYNRTIDKSKQNKIKLEDYIYSDKTKELNLLLNKQQWN